MKQFLYAVCTMLAFVLILAVLRGPQDTPHASTLEVLAQPEAALQLEAQRQAHEAQLAEIEARMADTQAEQQTLRLALILAGGCIVTVLGVSVWAALALSKRRNTFVLLPGAPGFHAALTELGGTWQDDTPIASFGREVKYLEVVE